MSADIPFFNARIAPDDCFDAWREQSLLTSLEQGGLQWPSSCRNGTCRTCIGHLVSGQVRYDMDWPGLTKEELAAMAGAIPGCGVDVERDGNKQFTLNVTGDFIESQGRTVET